MGGDEVFQLNILILFNGNLLEVYGMVFWLSLN